MNELKAIPNFLRFLESRINGPNREPNLAKRTEAKELWAEISDLEAEANRLRAMLAEAEGRYYQIVKHHNRCCTCNTIY